MVASAAATAPRTIMPMRVRLIAEAGGSGGGGGSGAGLTNAAIAVPTAWNGFDPDESSSM